jgi:SAM-dependent methyltransferase
MMLMVVVVVVCMTTTWMIHTPPFLLFAPPVVTVVDALVVVIPVIRTLRDGCPLDGSQQQQQPHWSGRHHHHQQQQQHGSSWMMMQATTKGFGASSSSSSGSSKNKSSKPSSSPSFSSSSISNRQKKDVRNKIQQRYGGITPAEIHAGTQRVLTSTLLALPPHLQRATQLYRTLGVWNATWENLSIYQRLQVPPTDVQSMQQQQNELHEIYHAYNVSPADLHNIWQQATWDASADAKAARAILSGGTMSQPIAQRIERACALIMEAVQNSTWSSSGGRCLDVGCGYGALVPIFHSHLSLAQIYGIDLSTEMIRNAKEMYPHGNWEAVDFLQYHGIPPNVDEDAGSGGSYVGSFNGFDGIIFCSSLHDMPNLIAALQHAVSLLRGRGSRLVIVHAQGAAHVLQQVQANPVLVHRGLPTTEELQELALEFRLKLVVEPAKANTPRDLEEGYLAMLEKVD